MNFCFAKLVFFFNWNNSIAHVKKSHIVEDFLRNWQRLEILNLILLFGAEIFLTEDRNFKIWNEDAIGQKLFDRK